MMNQQRILLDSPVLPPQIAPLIRKSGQNNVPILILGEQGTGKEWVARAIHQAGEWKYHPFHKIDCRMLKERTLFSQLVDFVKEIRYGAVPATVFCKEVGYLSHRDQLKLLELVEDDVFTFDGEKRRVKNLRWIASSSEDLKEKAEKGLFSEDLYDCLNALSLRLPTLRDRINDIPAIVRYLLAEHATRMNLKVKGVSQNALSLLQRYWWPGNLKELERVTLRSALFSDGESLMERDFYFDAEIENKSFFTFLGGTHSKNAFEKKEPSANNDPPLPWSFLLAELVHRIKNPLVSINTFTKMLAEKFDDGEFREAFYKVVTDDVERIDWVLNSLANYVKMNTALNKSNTIHHILEEALKRHESHFQERSIGIFKKLGKDLPETMIHEEQLRYIFGSLIQYVLPFLPPHGSIGCLTRLVEDPKLSKGEGSRSDKEREWIEILIVFTGLKKPIDKYETIFGVSSTQSWETKELELGLIHEIVKKNRGRMTVEFDEKKPKALVSFRLPIERRRVIYYSASDI